jgi:hypothetical protein
MEVTKQIGFYTVDLDISIIGTEEGYILDDQDFKVVSIFDNANECVVHPFKTQDVNWVIDKVFEDQQDLFGEEFAKKEADDKAEYGSYLADKYRDRLEWKAKEEENSH